MSKMRKYLLLSAMFWLLSEPAAYAVSLDNERLDQQAVLRWRVSRSFQGGTAVSSVRSEVLPDCTSHDHRETGVIKIRKLPNGSLTWTAERDDPLANPGFWLWEVLIHQPGKRLEVVPELVEFEVAVSARSLDRRIGKRMFDVGFEPWGDPPPFGMPVFVATHEAREPMPMQGGTTYTFVTDGIEAALELARAAAGDKNVGIWGGANIIREYLRAGLLDEMQIHLIPILLGDGIRLFEDLDPEGIELRRTSSIETPSATHFRFEVVK
jgi:dihydrofolate reductase